MKSQLIPIAAGLALTLGPGVAARASAQAVVGKPAPTFSLPDANGETHSLGSYKGRFVVLEWVNHECPFVGKHYGSGHMQKLQRTYTAKGVVWLSVDSSAPGKQGYMDAAQAIALTRQKAAAPSAVLLDPDGRVGRAYGAKTTPHMFIIDPRGVLIYNGAIDDTPSTDLADIATARNYVEAALEEALSGKRVSKATSQPYGCSVKYAN